MAEPGVTRLPGSLDPRAQEFRPSRSFSSPNHDAVLFQLPLQEPYFPYTSYYPPPPPDVQVVPFCDGVVAYSTHYLAPPPYVRPAGASVPPPILPPSSTPTRSLMLSSVPSEVSESTLRWELEAFGGVRGVEMGRASEGIVTVHFYDLRHAERIFREIREQYVLYNSSGFAVRNSVSCGGEFPGLLNTSSVRGRVWAQFVVPAVTAVPDGNNQGTIVVFNLDSDVSASWLREIFEAFGAVKELRETPSKKRQRFIEFFDVRDAAKALKEMNGKEINGKQIVIQFSRPGGHTRKFFNTISSSQAVINSGHYSRSTLNPPMASSGGFSSNDPRHSNRSPARSAAEENMDSRDIPVRMATVNLGNGVEEKVSCGPSTRTEKKSQVISKQQRHQKQPKNISKRGRQPKKLDSFFLINEDAMVESDCRDSRTTVMIKNIPNKYSLKLLLNMLDNHCIHCNEQISDGDSQPLSSYDFVYLPIDFNNKCNVGYGFVNMTSPQATWRLYKAFHLQHWEVFNSRKICEVTYARVQGLEALKEHFKNSKFPCETDEYLPVVFSPPRDGRRLTEPQPIVSHEQLIRISHSRPSTAASNDTTSEDVLESSTAVAEADADGADD